MCGQETKCRRKLLPQGGNTQVPGTLGQVPKLSASRLVRKTATNDRKAGGKDVALRVMRQNINQATVEQVGWWLFSLDEQRKPGATALQLGSFVAEFRQKKIDGAALLSMDDEALQELGMRDPVQRRALLQARDAIQAQAFLGGQTK